MTKDLTEKWKNGGLEKDKKYYTKDKLGRIYIKTYNKRGFKGIVEEVLCECPSYEKYKSLETGILLANTLIENTKEENAKLKELLKECRDVAEFTKTIVNKHKWFNEVITKIDEVLNECLCSK